MAKTFYFEERKILGALRAAGFAPKSIYDVGSSHSGWSRDVSGVFPDAQFFLFEPLVDFKPLYKAYTASILDKYPNFRLFKIVLGERDCERAIYSDAQGFGASILPDGLTAWCPEKYDVIERRLESIIAEHSLPLPDVIKMDVQGAELEVLKGAGEALRKVQFIQAELWFRRGYGPRNPLFHEVLEFLNGYNFALIEIGGPFFENRELTACEGYFVRRDVLAKLANRLPKQSLLILSNNELYFSKSRPLTKLFK